MRIVRITRANAEKYHDRVVALEGLATYPFGDDSFKLDHGEDYFAFFTRLGRLFYYAAVDDTKAGHPLVAVGAGVLRPRPRCWYMCDLKVHPDYRRRGIPLRMLRSVLLPNYLRCRRGYGISMNPGDGSENPVVRMMKRFRWLPFDRAAKLHIYSLDSHAMRELRPVVEAFRGRTGFLSLEGKKDVVMQSTGTRLPLLHLQFGPCAELEPRPESIVFSEPQPGSTHMFCAPEGDSLDLALRERGISHSATASVIHHGMKKQNWGFVLTSEI